MGLFLVDFVRCSILKVVFLGFNLFLGLFLDFIGFWLCMSYFSLGFNNFMGEILVFIVIFNNLYYLDL